MRLNLERNPTIHFLSEKKIFRKIEVEINKKLNKKSDK
jgi:hypothetical protein